MMGDGYIDLNNPARIDDVDTIERCASQGFDMHRSALKRLPPWTSAPPWSVKVDSLSTDRARPDRGIREYGCGRRHIVQRQCRGWHPP